MNKFKNFLRQIILKRLLPNNFYLVHNGYCNCCDHNVTFIATHSWLRDSLFCSNCKSIPRERAIMHVIEKYYPNWKSLSIHESSPVPRGASLKMKKFAPNYISSQYIPWAQTGEKINGVHNQNLEQQTFDNESFDIVITQDVMEHVYNPEKAFMEIARTLKKGGAHIFTVPIINKFQPSEQWAVKDDNNQPIFLKTPEWHGNPVSQKGSPVTMHWGFDIVNFIKEHSGLHTSIEYLNNLNLGIQAEYIEVFVSHKT